ncbi:MAG: DUF2298 domain-containing protein [Anaerolineae bacterium]
MVSALLWWLVVSLLGWAVWPATRRMFPSSPDRGWSLTRLIGLVLASYLYWLVTSIGLAPAGWMSVAIVSAACVLGGIVTWWCLRRNSSKLPTGLWREIATAEMVFAAAWLAYLAFRGGIPAIRHTEQPMDLAMLSATLHSRSMPPMDPWLAGEPVSYYYGGYLLVGVVAHLTGTPVPTAYNLGLGLYAALAISTLYGALRAALASTAQPPRARLIAAMGAVAVMGFSNLEPAFELLHARFGIEDLASWLGVPGLPGAEITGSWMPAGTWWWRASRVAADTTLAGRPSTLITEFPAFSLLLGDLHPHLMGLPYLGYALAVAAQLLSKKPGAKGGLVAVAASLPVLGYAGFVNTWDLPIVLGLVGLAWGIASWCRFHRLWRTLGEAVLMAVVLLCLCVLAYWPFYAQLESQVQGLAIVTLTRLRLGSFALHWGVWYVPIVVELCLGPLRKERSWTRVAGLWAAFATLPWVAVLALGGGGKLVLALAGAVIAGPWVGILLAGVVALMVDDVWSSLALQDADVSRGGLFARLAGLVGTGLILGTEFFFVRDLFGTRMNTVFKVYQQAWVLLGVAGVCAAYRLYRCGGRARWGLAPVGVVWLLALPYLPMAAQTRWQTSSESWTLDGASYLMEQAPDAYAAYRWLSEVGEPGDVLATAPGADYDATTSRLSALTGIPTVLGWPGHEVQWRGTDEMLARREADLATIYISRDTVALRQALERYGVRYVHIGPRERALYDLDDEHVAWLIGQWDPAFRSGDIVVLRVPGP